MKVLSKSRYLSGLQCHKQRGRRDLETACDARRRVPRDRDRRPQRLPSRLLVHEPLLAGAAEARCGRAVQAVAKETEALRASGYETIADIPELEAKTLDAIQARQRRAVITGEVIVEPTLAAALAALAEPIAFLDFESVNLALPVWRGSAPLCAVVVQHSVHRVEASGALTHHEFLTESGSDGREELARHLLEATAGAATVLAWSAGFERDRVAELAEHVPALAGELRSLAERIVDLLPIVRENVYHPEFRGSFSLKSVGPALVPELGYAGLEVADGFTASSWLAEYLVRGDEMTAEERAQLRAALLAYCGRDTEVLAGVWRVLGALVTFASK